jgi:hypothetical protein
VTIGDGSSQSAEASAAVCGDAGWVIDSRSATVWDTRAHGRRRRQRQGQR